MKALQLEIPTVLHPARRRAATDARPVLKWAGGKTQLLAELTARAPRRFGAYFEPFLGGGALFFHLQPARAVLNDVNAELVHFYRTVRDDVEALIRELRDFRYDPEVYYAVRATDPGELGPTGRAARFLYLNRTCFNGLYRVNRRGRFNVPMGRYKNPTICASENLRAASRSLAGRELRCGGFEEAVAAAEPGDLVYFDPPYHPVSATSNFTSYTPWPFGEAEQRALGATFDALADRGVRCMLTNSDAPLVHEIYGHHRVDRVLASRRISRDGAGRGPVGELIVRSF